VPDYAVNALPSSDQWEAVGTIRSLVVLPVSC
jgi:hypothetical protein